MSITDSVADYLTCIRNGCRSKKASVTVPASTLKIKLAEILKDSGFISDYSVVEDGMKKSLFIKLKYKKDGSSAIKNIIKMSKPGLRLYVESEKIPRVLNGLGIMVVSTSRGIMTDVDARKQNVGGELIFKVW